jgi:hypothetical protein
MPFPAILRHPTKPLAQSEGVRPRIGGDRAVIRLSAAQLFGISPGNQSSGGLSARRRFFCIAASCDTALVWP